MTKHALYIVRFPGNEPAWFKAEGDEATPCSAPAQGAALPVLALLPDEHFFYLHPKGAELGKSRSSRGAVLLQMQYSWPGTGPGRDFGVQRLPSGGLIGTCTGPGLDGFWRRHQAILEEATVISTEFLLVRDEALASGAEAWTWSGASGMRAVFADDTLHYFRADDDVEFEERRAALCGEAEPEAMDLERALAGLARRGVRPSRLHLRLPGHATQAQTAPALWKRVALVASVLGLLFSAGQGLRLLDAGRQAAAFETALDAEYTKVLGTDHGRDPYGRLLSRLQLAKGAQTKGVDVIGLLTALSTHAPKGFYLDSMTLNKESGALRGTAPSYDSVEKFLTALGRMPGAEFFLDQATTADKGISVSLRVTFD